MAISCSVDSFSVFFITCMGTIRKRFFGDKAFYLMVLGIAVPIMIHNGFTNFVNLLDNIMVGRLGTEPMSGVAISNNIIFVYNLCIFGGLSGAGIFTAQYYGKSDYDGVRNTMRFKLLLGLGLTILATVIFSFFGESLVRMFLNEGSSEGDLEATLVYAKAYMRLMLFGFPGFFLTQVYSTTLRECGETVVPMKAGIVAVLVNLAFNYLLIYGKFGLPALGVEGAALATVLSRYVEASIVMVRLHRHSSDFPFGKGLYRSFRIPASLSRVITKKGLPLLVNEALWSAGMSMLIQSYSMRGLNAVAGVNIAETMNNLFKVIFLAFGNSVGIIIGKLLGAGEMEEARETDRKMIVFSMMVSAASGLVMLCIAPFFPRLYNTTDAAKAIATSLMIAQGLCLPIEAFKNATYFTLRSGGRTFITFLFDGFFVWAVSLPIAFVLSRFTSASVLWIFISVQLCGLLKCVCGIILVKKGVWLRNIVTE